MIRIISGTFRGRKLMVPPERFTRPTTDRVRESIFNLLHSYLVKQELAFNQLTVLDAYAGSGGLGFEALSHGAQHVTFFEKNGQALHILHLNAHHLKLESEQITLYRTDTLAPPRATTPVGLIFLDPPYFDGVVDKTIIALQNAGWLGPETILVIEQHEKSPLPQKLSPESGWAINRLYGHTRILIDTF
jgi:16S rRNA (guanine966-N2)-methyltransferase